MSRGASKARKRPESDGQSSLHTLTRILNVGLLALDRDGELEFASPVAMRLLGCEDLEGLRRRWTGIKGLLRLDEANSRNGAGTLRYVIEVPVDGAMRSLRLEIYRPDSESCAGRLVLLKDRRTVDMLEADLVLASQMRSLVHVYRVMAHDLKAPLNSMQLTLELLADSLADEDPFGAPAGARERRQRHVSILREELSRLNRALHSMLDQGELLGTKPHAFDLRELARETVRLLTPQARRQRVELDVQLPDGEVRVTGYRDRLKQAFVNLVLSGLDGMAGGGRLTIRFAMDEMARVSIQDSGEGMPYGLVEEIYQNHYTREKSPAGARLYVARLVAESHGGELAVESGAGRGTRFLLALPLANLAAPDAAEGWSRARQV